MRTHILPFRPRRRPAAPTATGESTATHLRSALQILQAVERGRAVLTTEAGQPTIRLGLALLPDTSYVALRRHLETAIEQLEARP